MKVTCLRPNLSEMRFRLFRRPLHPELFDIQQEQHIHRDDYQGIVRITNGCHLVGWRHDDVSLTEVIAPHRTPLPKRCCLVTRKLGRERTETIQCSPQITYQTSITVDYLDRQVFSRMHDELEQDARQRGLFHSFRANHRLSPSPLSHLMIEARLHSMLVLAFHTFPDEFAIVKCVSLFEFAR